MPTYFTEGNTAAPGDNEMRSLQKIVSLGVSGSGSGTYSSGGNFFGNGDPNGVVAANKGATYVQLDVSPPALWMKTTDTVNTGWE